jgi:hypothetical protein
MYTDDLAAGFCEMQMKKGDVLGLWLGNDAENVGPHSFSLAHS